MTNNHTTYSLGCGGTPFGLLGILFIILKVTHYVDWSWWIVLLPFYLPIVATVAILGGFVVLWVWANSRKSY